MRNPDASLQVNCARCKRQFALDEMLQEESLFAPYELTVEGFMLCPRCGHRRHIYYLTEELRFRQVQLKALSEQWHESKDMQFYRQFMTAQTVYKAMFDREQKRYAEIVEKAASRGETSGESTRSDSG